MTCKDGSSHHHCLRSEQGTGFGVGWDGNGGQNTTMKMSFPARWPTYNPTRWPTYNPTRWPTYNPTRWPTYNPTRWPTYNPTRWPTYNPTRRAANYNPTRWPTYNPTRRAANYTTEGDVHNIIYTLSQSMKTTIIITLHNCNITCSSQHH